MKDLFRLVGFALLVSLVAFLASFFLSGRNTADLTAYYLRAIPLLLGIPLAIYIVPGIVSKIATGKRGTPNTFGQMMSSIGVILLVLYMFPGAAYVVWQLITLIVCRVYHCT